MRRTGLKRIARVAGACAVAIVVLLLLPPVQTALVRLLVGGVEGLDVEVGRLWAGPWGADVRGLRLRGSSVEVEIPHGSADVAFWSSLGHFGLHIEEVTAERVRVRVGSAPESRELEAKSERFEFNGLSPLAHLPKRLVVQRAVAEGSVEIAFSEALGISGPWSLSAADVGTNRRPSGALTTRLSAARGGEIVAAAEVTASLDAVVDPDGAVTNATADAGLHALGEQGRGLDANVELELAPDDESYRLTVDGSGGHRVVDASATFDPAARSVEAAWTADISKDLLAVFARGHALPELSAVSQGSAQLDLSERRLEIECTGRLEGRGWSEFDPRLREVSKLLVDLDLAGAVDRGHLEARRLRVALTGAAGRELLRMTALQPLEIDLEAWRFVPEAWGESALRLEADRFPLRWTRGFDPALVVESGGISLALDVVPVDVRHTKLVTHEPIRATDLQVRAGADGFRVPPLEITIVPALEFDNGVLEAEIESARLTASTGFDMRLSGKASTSRALWPVVSLAGDLSIAVPRLQRLIGSLDRIRGVARFDLDLRAMVLAVDGGKLGVTANDGHSLMEVWFENDEPLRLALPAATPDWESASPQHVTVRFDGLPIAWVSPFIPELEFTGGALFGELEAVAGGGRGLTLEPAAPFEIRDLQPVYRGRAFAVGSTASVEPRLRLDNTSLRFALENLRFRTPDHDRLDGEAVLEAVRDGSGRVDASLILEGEFPTVVNRIGKLGALSWRQKAVIDVPNRSLEITDLDVGLTDAAGTQFLELESTRPFTVAAEPFEIRIDGGSPEILRATVTPLQLQQLFPRVLGFQLEGVLPQGQFVGRVENGGILLVADEPLVFRDVTVRWEEAALLDRVTLGLKYQVLYSVEGLRARSIEFSTTGPSGSHIADGTLRAVMPLTDRSTLESLHFETLGNLEPLTRQPIFRELPAFVEGTIGGAVEYTRGTRSTLAGSLQLRGARVEGSGVLPDLDAALDVQSVAGEHLDVKAPVSLDSENGASDLTFEGGVVKENDSFRFDAALVGSRIVVPDVMRLVRLVAPPERDMGENDYREKLTSAFRKRWSKAAIAQLRERRDEAPVWGSRVSGRATLDLESVELARYTVTGVHGELDVDPARIALRGAEASLLGAHLAMEGSLAFDGAAELPYDLQFNSSFDDLDLGRLFRAVEPDAPPTLDGDFEVRTTASGRGRNLADLGLGTLGSVHVSGRDGVFRGMAGQFGFARTGTKVIGFLTFSKQLKAISRLLGELEALEFDTFDLELARETPRRFGISELTVVSPLARIDGTGGVEVEPGLPLALSPLDMTLDLGTRGDMTILCDGLGLLGEDEGPGGYRPLTRRVTVGGTVAEPDTTEFYEMLDEAASDSKGVIGVAMRRVNKKLQKGR